MAFDAKLLRRLKDGRALENKNIRIPISYSSQLEQCIFKFREDIGRPMGRLVDIGLGLGRVQAAARRHLLLPWGVVPIAQTSGG